MPKPEEIQIAETEAVFREVNERIAQTAERFEVEEPEFVCECADPACAHRVAAPLDDYNRVREDGTRFLFVPGHEDPRVERVVRRRRGYQIVEKVNHTVAALVRRLDPRAENV